MPSPRCTDHQLSVGEYVKIFRFYREYFRNMYSAKLSDKKAIDTAVSAELVKIANSLVLMGPCCRHQLLNVDTLYDYIARRDTF